MGTRTTLGSGSAESISLKDRRVPPRALELLRDDGVTRFRNLDPPRRVIVNGQVVEEGSLQYGDWLAIGGSTLVYAVESPFAPNVDIWEGIDDGAFEIQSTRPPYATTRQLLDSLPRPAGDDPRLMYLCKVCLELSRLQDLRAIGDRVLAFLLEFFPAERVFLLVASDRGPRALRLTAARARAGPDPGPEHFCRSVARKVATSHTSILSTNPASDDRFEPGESVFELGIRAILCAPLLRDRKLVGMVQLTSSRKGASFSETDLELLTAIACTVAIAVENGMTRLKLSEQTRNLFFLSRASQELSSVLNREQIIREGVRRACSIMACTKGSLIIARDDGGLGLAFAVGMPSALVQSLQKRPFEARRVREVLRTGRPLHVVSTSEETASGECNMRYATGSFIIVPVRNLKGEVFGTLSMTDKLNGSPFQGTDVELLTVFASQMGTALENARLYERAITDPLTGLHVRHHLDLSLGDTLRERPFDELSLALLDLDDFKQVNDRHGHQAGDDVLRAVGSRLRDALRPKDLCARYGGEEFAIMMPGAGRKVAARIAERLRAAVSERAFTTRAGRMTITVSVGVCVWRPGETPTELLARADKALYSAKGQGKDRVVFSA